MLREPLPGALTAVMLFLGSVCVCVTLLGQGFLCTSSRQPLQKRPVLREFRKLKTNGPAYALFNPAENKLVNFALFLLLMV